MNTDTQSFHLDESQYNIIEKSVEQPSIVSMLLRVKDLLETLSEDERLQFITIEQMDTLRSCEFLSLDKNNSTT